MPNGLGLKRDLTKFMGLIKKKEKASALNQLELGGRCYLHLGRGCSLSTPLSGCSLSAYYVLGSVLSTRATAVSVADLSPHAHSHPAPHGVYSPDVCLQVGSFSSSFLNFY